MKWNLKVLPLIALAAALGTTGVFAQSSPQAQTAVPSSGMDMQSMKAQMRADARADGTNADSDERQHG